MTVESHEYMIRAHVTMSNTWWWCCARVTRLSAALSSARISCLYRCTNTSSAWCPHRRQLPLVAREPREVVHQGVNL